MFGVGSKDCFCFCFLLFCCDVVEDLFCRFSVVVLFSDLSLLVFGDLVL